MRPIALGLLARLGWRNLLRRRRRNLLFLAALMVGVAIAIFLQAIVNGMLVDMQDLAIRNMTGHAKIIHPKYRDDPDVRQSFVPTEVEQLLAAQLSGRAVWGARVHVPAVLVSERHTRGAALIGVDPDVEGDLSIYGDMRIEGRSLSQPSDRGVLIGRDLLERLQTRIGKRLVLMARGMDGRTVEAGVRILGVYDLDTNALERQYIFIGRETAQSLLGMDAAVNEIAIRWISSPASLSFVPELQAALPHLLVLDWTELQPQIAGLVEFSGNITWIWYLIVFVGLSFGLINTLLTSIHERTRELGLLQAIGMRPGAVVAQVTMESMLLVCIGLLVGLALGALCIYWLRDGIDISRWAQGAELYNMSQRMTPLFSWTDVWRSLLSCLLLGFFGSLYPAYRAVRLDPLRALRFKE